MSILEKYPLEPLWAAGQCQLATQYYNTDTIGSYFGLTGVIQPSPIENQLNLHNLNIKLMFSKLLLRIFNNYEKSNKHVFHFFQKTIWEINNKKQKSQKHRYQWIGNRPTGGSKWSLNKYFCRQLDVFTRKFTVPVPHSLKIKREKAGKVFHNSYLSAIHAGGLAACVGGGRGRAPSCGPRARGEDVADARGRLAGARRVGVAPGEARPQHGGRSSVPASTAGHRSVPAQGPALVSSFGREDFLGQNIVWSWIRWEENCADIRHSSQSRVVGKLSKSCYFDCKILVKKGGTVSQWYPVCFVFR